MKPNNDLIEEYWSLIFEAMDAILVLGRPETADREAHRRRTAEIDRKVKDLDRRVAGVSEVSEPAAPGS